MCASCTSRINSSLLPSQSTGVTFLLSFPHFLVIWGKHHTTRKPGPHSVWFQPVSICRRVSAHALPQQEHSLAHIAICLLQLWYFSPPIWPLQTKAQFELTHIITQTTQCRHVVTVFPLDITLEVADVISSPPQLIIPMTT